METVLLLILILCVVYPTVLGLRKLYHHIKVIIEEVRFFMKF